MKKIKIKISGRPGWHIECSVMSQKFLKTDTLDIHAGGRDLIFPHHENEIAQSEAFTGKQFAKYWIHNGLLTTGGRKMSKSLGNFVTIRNFITKYKDADLLKLLFLSSHYARPVDYTEDKIKEAARMKERISIFSYEVDEARGIEHKLQRTKDIEKIREKFIAAMDDDFNTPEALAAIFELINLGNVYLLKKNIESAIGVKDTLLTLVAILGISAEEFEIALEEKYEKLIKERTDARVKGDFEKADKIRTELLKKGVILEDTKTGTKWRRKV